jgi:hypothetical protein
MELPRSVCCKRPYAPHQGRVNGSDSPLATTPTTHRHTANGTTEQRPCHAKSSDRDAEGTTASET